MREFTYDEECEELARHFLADIKHIEYDVQSLAQHIQAAVEAWLSDYTTV